jgi:hypothetical protein
MMAKPYRDAQLEADLLRMGTDDAAFSHLLRARRSLTAMRRAALTSAAARERYDYYARKLGGIPTGVTCACCGYEGLVNVMRRDGEFVGPECFNHRIGTCKRRSA